VTHLVSIRHAWLENDAVFNTQPFKARCANGRYHAACGTLLSKAEAYSGGEQSGSCSQTLLSLLSKLYSSNKQPFKGVPLESARV